MYVCLEIWYGEKNIAVKKYSRIVHIITFRYTVKKDKIKK